MLTLPDVDQIPGTDSRGRALRCKKIPIELDEEFVVNSIRLSSTEVFLIVVSYRS